MTGHNGKRLGAVLAGGLSTRFGSDKALAELHGRRLLDLAASTLAAQCDAVVIVGRLDARHVCVPDWPAPHAGPLGGMAGALRHALEQGYETVLTMGVDSVALPDDLATLLSPAPACLEAQPVVGLWPAAVAGIVEGILLGAGKHSVRRFAEAIGARAVAVPIDPVNVNTPADLDAAARRSAR